MDYQNAPLTVAKIADGVRVTFNGPIHTNTAWIERELDTIVKSKPLSDLLENLADDRLSAGEKYRALISVWRQPPRPPGP